MITNNNMLIGSMIIGFTIGWFIEPLWKSLAVSAFLLVWFLLVCKLWNDNERREKRC